MDSKALMTLYVVFFVVFVLLRLLQLVVNFVNKPYVVSDEHDLTIASVYIYRMQRFHSTYREYLFRYVDGRWIPVIKKSDIVIGLIVAGIVASVFLFAGGVTETWIIIPPIAIFLLAMFLAHRIEAYLILMRN